MSEAEDLMKKCCFSKCRGHALEAENKQLKETVKAGGECCRQLQERINRLEYALKGK